MGARNTRRKILNLDRWLEARRSYSDAPVPDLICRTRMWSTPLNAGEVPFRPRNAAFDKLRRILSTQTDAKLLSSILTTIAGQASPGRIDGAHQTCKVPT